MATKFATGTLLVASVFGTSTAAARQHLSHRDAVTYGRAYAHVADKLGKRAAGCKLIGPNATCHGRLTPGRVMASTDVLHRMLAPPPPPVTSAPATSTSYSSSSGYSSASTTSTGGYGNVPGVPASFAACVATRESSNGAGSSNIYGIIPASGSNAGSGSLAEQKAAFAQLYAQYGTAPWSPYDHC